MREHEQGYGLGRGGVEMLWYRKYLYDHVLVLEGDKGKELKGLFIDLVLALELVQAFVHTDATLDALEAELVRVLSGLEILLPLTWNTHARHCLLHSCEMIRRCGPFFTHNMLTFERWHTAFKKCVRSGHHVMAGVANVYAMMWSSNVWQCASQGGAAWHAPPTRRSTISGRRAWSYDAVTISVGKKPGRAGALGTESCGAFVQV